ncbi:MAG: AIM24 family protein, partial [Nitrososphaeraceae archaeon]
AYGGIIQKNLGDNEKIILDNHHLVALSENSNYRVIKFGWLKTTILGGEGLVTEITGPGSVYSQTKNIPDFVNYLGIKQTSESESTWRYDST